MPSGAADTGQHQNIARAAAVLDALAHVGVKGLRLTEVTKATGMSKTSAHRCLAGLVSHGLACVHDDGETTRYYVGDRIYAWIQIAAERFSIADRIKPYLEKLAHLSGDTSYFMLRRDDIATCLGRAEGSYPIKTLTLAIGDQRHLGTNTASIAILSSLSPQEAECIINGIPEADLPPELGKDVIRSLVSEGRSNGYSMIEGHVMAGMSGIGIALKSADAAPIGSLSIAAISPRLNTARKDEIVDLLRSVVAEAEEELRPILGRSATNG